MKKSQIIFSVVLTIGFCSSIFAFPPFPTYTSVGFDVVNETQNTLQVENIQSNKSNPTAPLQIVAGTKAEYSNFGSGNVATMSITIGNCQIDATSSSGATNSDVTITHIAGKPQTQCEQQGQEVIVRP